MRKKWNLKKSLCQLKKDGNYILFHKKKYYRDASTIAKYLATVIKQYSKEILYIFDALHQTSAKDVIWKDRISCSIEEDELENDLKSN